jgi:hypothetical protein
MVPAAGSVAPSWSARGPRVAGSAAGMMASHSRAARSSGTGRPCLEGPGTGAATTPCRVGSGAPSCAVAARTGVLSPSSITCSRAVASGRPCPAASARGAWGGTDAASASADAMASRVPSIATGRFGGGTSGGRAGGALAVPISGQPWMESSTGPSAQPSTQPSTECEAIAARAAGASAQTAASAAVVNGGSPGSIVAANPPVTAGVTAGRAGRGLSPLPVGPCGCRGVDARPGEGGDGGAMGPAGRPATGGGAAVVSGRGPSPMNAAASRSGGATAKGSCSAVKGSPARSSDTAACRSSSAPK